MSDGEGRSGKKEQDDGQTCRDFLRNVCERGARCRFKHPESAAKTEKNLQDKMMFCHDFQNGRCSRSTCKFIHCPKEVESEYLDSGYLPPLVREQVIKKAVGVDFPAVGGGVPTCKDFLNGRCDRGSSCRFRHLSQRDYDIELNSLQHRPVGGSGSAIPVMLAGGNSRLPPFLNQSGGREDGEWRDRKRRHMEPGGMEGAANSQLAFHMLQEENALLRQRVLELEKRVSDLTATNEFLLDQNAQLRLGPQRQVASMFGGLM